MVDVGERIRVVLVDIPPLLCDIVYETVRGAADVVVVGEASRRGPRRSPLKQSAADVMIVGTSTPEDFSLPRQLLIEEPRTRVLMLAVGGRSAVAYELQPHQTSLDVVSPETLLETIRTRAGRTAWQRPL